MALAASQFQLARQALLIHPDAHGGQLKGPLAHAVPHQQVAVEGPVVVVRGPAMLGKAHIGEVQSSLWDGENVKAAEEAGFTLL